MLTRERKKELLFPYEEVRKIQENLLLDVEKTVKGKGRLIADAPTGLGKTASALGPALAYALENGLTVWFLTNRHTQHRLAVETLKLISEKFGVEIGGVDLIGKRWMCGQEVKGLFASEFQEFCRAVVEKGECEFYNKTKEKGKLTVEGKKRVEELAVKGVLHNEEVYSLSEGFCPYEISLELGKKAQVIIGDYYYLFDPFVQQMVFKKMEKELERSIIIVDEAHNLPRRVIDLFSSKLTTNMLKKAILEAEKFGYAEAVLRLKNLSGVLEELNNGGRESFGYPKDLSKNWGAERLVAKEEFKEKVKDYEKVVEELEMVSDEIRKKKKRSYVGGVASFLEKWLGEDRGFVRIIAELEGKYGRLVCLSYDCLDPGLFTKAVFERVDSAVLMSGTLNPTFMYNDILRIKGVERNYENPFPAENKLSLIVPETSTKYSLRGKEMYSLIGEKCSSMLSLIPGNCAVFFPSYQLRDVIGPLIVSSKKKFWEKSEMSKEEREEFLEEFKGFSDSGGVLLGVMGGSFGEGIDLPGDLLQGVIVVGVPLGRPDLKTREVIRYFERKFRRGWDYGYLFPAMCKCFQSAGRCIRSAEDKGAVVFLDERFAGQSYFCCFPKEGLVVSRDYEKLIKEFFRN